MVVYHSELTVLRCSSGTIAACPVFPKKRDFFWVIEKLCGIQREEIFLTVKYSCNIECLLVPLMSKVVSYLTIGHMTILQYRLVHSLNGFRNNNCFWTIFTKFVLERTTTSVEFTIPSINTGPSWSFSAKNCIKFIDTVFLS